MAIVYPSYLESRAQAGVLSSTIKEKDALIKTLLEETRQDSLAREKTITTQRDYFVEMIRSEFIRLTNARTLQPEPRYIRKDHD